MSRYGAAGRAGVEDQFAVLDPVHGRVVVPEHDCVHVHWEQGNGALLDDTKGHGPAAQVVELVDQIGPPTPVAVGEAEGYSLECKRACERQFLEAEPIAVAAHGRDRSYASQLIKDRRQADITGMEDMVHAVMRKNR